MDIHIRPARISDASEAAVLLAATTHDLGVAALGLGSTDLQLKAFRTWFSDEHNRFSYEHGLIADAEGAAAGLMVRFAGSDLMKLELGCGRKLFKIYGFFEALRMMWMTKLKSQFREAERDEYLVAHLATHPDFQRRGIGQLLLERAAGEAQNLGLNKLVLEVDMDNEPAIQLYRKFGFEIAKTVEFGKNAKQLHCKGFHKLLKNL